MTNQDAIKLIEHLKEEIVDLSDNEIQALDLAIKALSESKITVFTENQAIRWTDKVSLKDNGDIIDFDGKVMGHINFDAVEE